MTIDDRRVIEAYVFDFDGLILDTEEPVYRSWLEVYEAHGEELPFEPVAVEATA